MIERCLFIWQYLYIKISLYDRATFSLPLVVEYSFIVIVGCICYNIHSGVMHERIPSS